MYKSASLLIFLLVLFMVFISIRATFPPAIQKDLAVDSAFSVKRAAIHVDSISALPHSTGSARHEFVRNYIINACTQLGFKVELQSATSVRTRRNAVQAANIQNILAGKAGPRNGKTIVLMAHYDTEPNTGGAGDDGAGVAAMLETARALHHSSPLKNDLLLLFTDGEEVGLLGAKAFVESHPFLKDIAIVINFEGRGNAGPSNMFEVNPRNGWAVTGYATGAAYPFANSLGYEIYKNLPNATDYTLFKDAGITGLNNAFIDGFSNYHSMNDKPGNLDLRSLQHHGENMISLARHFGQLDITDTKAPDRTYFNTLGYHFIHYPASWNIILVVLANLCFVGYILLGFRKRIFKVSSLALSSFIFPLGLAIVYFFSSFLLKIIIKFYPLYKHFDENNSYNSHWYFGAMAALAVSVVSMLYWLLSRKVQPATLYGSILFLLVILMNLMQYAVPSASYLLFIPLLFIIPVQCFFLVRKLRLSEQEFKWRLLNFAGVLPAICLLSPIIYYGFIAFALGENLPFIAVGTALLAGMAMPIIFQTFNYKLPLVPVFAFLCAIAALIAAHTSAGYTQQHPLPSSLYYSMDADSLKASWRSDFSSTDQFTSRFFQGKVDQRSGTRTAVMVDAPLQTIPAPIASLTTDTIENELRKLSIHFDIGRPGVNLLGVEIANAAGANFVSINGKAVTPVTGTSPKYLTFYAPGEKGFDAQFRLMQGEKLNLVITASSIGLPVTSDFDINYPPGIIPAQGRSNSTQVKKHFSF